MRNFNKTEKVLLISYNIIHNGDKSITYFYAKQKKVRRFNLC